VCFFSGDIGLYHDDNSTYWREILHDGRSIIQTAYSPFGGNIFRGHQMRDRNKKRGSVFGFYSHLTANVSKTVSRSSVTCQLELNISSTRAF